MEKRPRKALVLKPNSKFMVWLITLLGYWMAFAAAGFILAIVGTFLLSRINRNFFGCIPVAILFILSYAGLALLTWLAVPQEYWNPTYDPQALELDAFVAEMSPSLQQKILQLKAKQIETADKIQQLKRLRNERPNFAERITTEIARWEELLASIETALERIEEATEKALVDYQINEISGRDRFSKVSEQLQEDANRVLDLAGVLQASINRQSPEQQSGDDSGLSLDEMLRDIQ